MLCLYDHLQLVLLVCTRPDDLLAELTVQLLAYLLQLQRLLVRG